MKELNLLKLSIIVPVYNVERYILSCIESIYSQGLDDSEFELLLINDGTTDKSFDIISSLIQKHNNIFVLSQENKGPSVARNVGLLRAKGQYVLFVDSDDLLVKNSIGLLLEIAISNMADLVVFDYLKLSDPDITYSLPNNYNVSIFNKTGQQLYLDDLDPHQCYVWRIMYNRDFLMLKSLSFEFLGTCFEDIPFVQECYLKAENCIRTNQLAYIYRVGHDSMTSSMNVKKMLDLNISIERLWNMLKLDNISNDVVKKMKDNLFTTFSFGLWCISHNNFLLNEWKVIVGDLKCKLPDLWFNNGIKQKFVSWMFWHFPGIYLRLRFMNFRR